ncbi:MAG: cation transporter [Collinsella sp.]
MPGHVDRAVGNLDGVSNVAVNLLAGSMAVDYDENAVDADAICAAVDRAGYAASPIEAGGSAGTGASAAAPRLESPTKKLEAQARAMRGRLIASIALPHPAVLPRHGPYARLAASRVFRSAREHHERGAHRAAAARTDRLRQRLVLHQRFKSLIHGAPTMDALIAIGSAASIGWSIVGIYRIGAALTAGDPHAAHMVGMDNLYLESAGTILALVTVGKYLETRSRVQDGRRHRASHRPRPQDRNGRRRGRYANHRERR